MILSNQAMLQYLLIIWNSIRYWRNKLREKINAITKRFADQYYSVIAQQYILDNEPNKTGVAGASRRKPRRKSPIEVNLINNRNNKFNISLSLENTELIINYLLVIINILQKSIDKLQKPVNK